MTSQAVIDKAARLVDEERVQELPAMGGGCRHWIVTGDTPRLLSELSADGDNQQHYVTTRKDYARCSCQMGLIAMQTNAQPRCSHSLAALFSAKRKLSDPLPT